MIRRVLIFAALATFLLPAGAATERVVFDPAMSELSFTLDTTLHVVHGTLGLTSGEIEFDTDTGRAVGTLVVDASRARTGNRKRDAKMHETVLESALFPSFVFRAERVDGEFLADGSGRAELHGSLEIHGQSHPFTLPARVTIVGDRVEAHAEFVIPYVEWGMKDPSLFIIRAAKTVDVAVHARGRIANDVAGVAADRHTSAP